jgi:hypothetical protein
MAVKIKEKDILFIAVNLVMFFSFYSYFFMQQAAIALLPTIQQDFPTCLEGMVYIFYTFSEILMVIAGMLTLLIDIWWAYRVIQEYRKGYWKENL